VPTRTISADEQEPVPVAPSATGAGPGDENEVPPRVHRPRIGAQIMDKLDEILANVKNEPETVENDEGRPEVTFEPEETQLPTSAEIQGEEEVKDEGISEQGEGTANTAEIHRPKFGFPHRQKVGIER